MSMRVLVTGGLGYLGGRIALALAGAGGFEVRLATRRPASALPVWTRDFSVVHLGSSDPKALERGCENVDAVLHLSCANEHASAADPAQALIDTALGTLALLQTAERQGVARFVHMSTAHVYGVPLAGCIDENTLVRPVHPYAIAHRTAEDFVLAARARGALGALVFRLSNALGAPADPLVNRWTLIGNDLCRQAASDGAEVLRTSGLQERDFIAVSDVCRAVLHVLRLPHSVWTEGDGLFNLGGNRSMSILDLAHLIAARAEIVLGFRPHILRPDSASGVNPPALDFRTDKLERTGFVLAGGLEKEIDSTLVLCRDTYAVREHVR